MFLATAPGAICGTLLTILPASASALLCSAAATSPPRWPQAKSMSVATAQWRTFGAWDVRFSRRSCLPIRPRSCRQPLSAPRHSHTMALLRWRDCACRYGGGDADGSLAIRRHGPGAGVLSYRLEVCAGMREALHIRPPTRTYVCPPLVSRAHTYTPRSLWHVYPPAGQVLPAWCLKP